MSTTSSSLSRLQELLPELFQTTNLLGKLYLRCQITSAITALIPMEYVQESLLVPREEITPIPEMSGFFMGLMNSRDHVFFALDLPQLLGCSPLSPYSRDYHTIVINISPFLDQSLTSEGEIFLGFAVNQIQGITRIISDEMRSPQENLSSSLTSYLQGWVMDKEQQLPVLDLATIVKQTL
jgi:twitching motility protein PilI